MFRCIQLYIKARSTHLNIFHSPRQSLHILWNRTLYLNRISQCSLIHILDNPASMIQYCNKFTDNLIQEILIPCKYQERSLYKNSLYNFALIHVTNKW